MVALSPALRALQMYGQPETHHQGRWIDSLSWCHGVTMYLPFTGHCSGFWGYSIKKERTLPSGPALGMSELLVGSQKTLIMSHNEEEMSREMRLELFRHCVTL